MNTFCHLTLPLSAREIDILTLAARGLGNKEMARRLKISSRTVEIHRQRIYGRLGASNGMHAVALAVAAGIVKIELTEKLRQAAADPEKVLTAAARMLAGGRASVA